MHKKKIFGLSSIITLFTGIGVLIGNSLSKGSSNTPFWVGFILVLLSALFLGMYLSTKIDNQIDQK